MRETLGTLFGSVWNDLKPGLQATQEDLRRTVEHVMADFFQSLNLVTREEWLAQEKLIAELQEKIERLEAALKERQAHST